MGVGYLWFVTEELQVLKEQQQKLQFCASQRGSLTAPPTHLPLFVLVYRIYRSASSLLFTMHWWCALFFLTLHTIALEERSLSSHIAHYLWQTITTPTLTSSPHSSLPPTPPSPSHLPTLPPPPTSPPSCSYFHKRYLKIYRINESGLFGCVLLGGN